MLPLCQLAMLTCRSRARWLGDCALERVRGRNSSDSIAGNAARRTRFGAGASLARAISGRAPRRRTTAAVRGLAVRLHCHGRGVRNRARSFPRSLGHSEMDRLGVGIHLDRLLSGAPQVARDRLCFGISSFRFAGAWHHYRYTDMRPDDLPHVRPLKGTVVRRGVSRDRT